MAKRVSNNMTQKLEYIGLDLYNIPIKIKRFKPLEFKPNKKYDEKQYKQYKYVPVKDIQILITPANRLDELDIKYKKASPLMEYLDNESEQNIVKYTTFLKMLRQVKIEDIEKVEEEQKKLQEKIPFKVKFEGNYLWQIYYSENTDQYFMLVPTEDSDYSTFFYLLKKQLEPKRAEKIFVPICNLDYTRQYLKKQEYEDIENYLWLFTKDWPLIYEVQNKYDELSIEIIGETQVYGKIKSPYRIVLHNKTEAGQFYKLLKAMYIMQTELPHYFEFKTNINQQGSIEFYFGKERIEYHKLSKWVTKEYLQGIEKQEIIRNTIKENEKKLSNLKEEVSNQEIEYLAKEKQITTFLECKKTFFGKFKYYFKYNKKGKRIKTDKDDIQNIEDKDNSTNKTEIDEIINVENKVNYTIEELIDFYRNYGKYEEILKNLIMDINALKLKSKNMKKKIENATAYIEEIDSHKKSIFEFWKYSNKDEVASLTEGEKEETNIIKNIKKVFDYEEDLEEFGTTMDNLQRSKLTKEQLDSIYLTTTDILNSLNKVKMEDASPKDFEQNLKSLKKQAIEEKLLMEDEEFDIFGGIAQDITKTSQIGDKKHRELPRNKFNILDINRSTKSSAYKESLQDAVKNIEEALKKVVLPDDLPIYFAINDRKLNRKKINVFDLNPKSEIAEALKEDGEKIYFYQMNLKRGINAVSYTNIIFYENQNKTLPVGQDLSTKILVDASKLKFELKNKTTFNILKMQDDEDDFSDIQVKTVTLLEYDVL